MNMRWPAAALLLVSAGCAANSSPSAPDTVTSLERQAAVAESSPQPLTSPTGLATETEFGPALAEEELSVDVPAEFDSTPLTDSEFVAGEVEQSDAPDSRAPSFAVPGKPTNVKVTAKGLVITMTWGPAPAGTAGPPTHYFVYCSCTARIERVGFLVFLKRWTATKPGTYTGFVSAANSKGAGPTVNFSITVGSDGTYTATPVSQTATLTRKFSGFSCTWRITLKATLTVKITGPKSGTTRVASALSWPKPSAKCTGGTAAYTHQAPLAFTATGFSSSHTLGFVKGKFEGAFVSGAIKGFLRMVYMYGTGRYDIPVLLKKT